MQPASRFKKSKYKKVGVLPIRIVKSNVSSVGPSSERNNIFLSDEGPTLETLDFLYFDLYLNTAYPAHCVYFALKNGARATPIYAISLLFKWYI